MKKILSLFALLMAIVTGANAQTTIFEYTVAEGDTPDNATAATGTVELGAAKVEQNSNVPGVYAFKSDGQPEAEKNSTKYVKAIPTQALQAGDVISVNMFATSNPDGTNYGVALYSENEAGATPVTTLYLGAKIKNTPTTYSYTVQEGDALVGAEEIYFFRATGKSTYIVSVKIESSGSAPTPTGEPAITKQPQDVTYIIGSTDYPNMEVEAVASAGDLQYQWQYMNPLTSEYANIPDQITSAKTSVLSGQEAVAFVGSFVTGPATFWVKCVVSDDNGSVESSAAALIIKNKSVATPVVDPASGTKFAESITMTATCETEGATIYYLDGNDWLELPAEGVTFTETTSTQVKAICEGYDDSDIVSVSYTKFEKSDIVPINSETEWTLTSSLTLQLSGETMPKKSDELYTYSDIASLNNITLPAGFDGTTLAFSGEYVFRENNGAQNALLQFNTEVSGNVEIVFSNTGGSNKGRYVMVNDQIGKVEADGTKHQTETFFVEKGDVSITGYNPDPEGNPALRFYSIKFTPAEAPTVTLNSEGFATFSCAKHVEIAPGTAGVKVYYANDVKDGKLYLAELGDGIIPAETGVVLAGEAGTVVQFVETDDPDLIIQNLLKPTTTANGLVPVPENPTDGSPDALTLDGKVFKTFTGATFNANKAYLVKHEIVDAMGGNTLEIKFAEATGVNGVAEAKAEVAPAKVIKNGQLFIGNFNIAGQRVQ